MDKFGQIILYGVKRVSNYYKNHHIEGIEHLKGIFPDGEANDLNWCMLSTSGVHGLYINLDDIEKEFNKGEHRVLDITVLVIMPRIVSMLWGNISIVLADIPYLRKLVTSSLRFIGESQIGNIEQKNK